MALTWSILVDFNRDGTFETELLTRTFGLSVERGRKSMLGDKGFTREGEGVCVINCHNDDSYFDFLNTASPIYPNALPGRECKITVSDGVTTWAVFRGRIADIVPVGADYEKTATILIVDGWAALKNKISYGVVKGADTGTLIGYVLDKSNYSFSNGGLSAVWRFPTRIGETSYFGPASWTRSLETGTDTLDYWWLREEVAADAVRDLVDSELGLFWFGADGVANFKSRHKLYIQASEATLIQDKFLRTLAPRQSLKNMRNTIRVKAYPKVLQNPAVLWKLSQKPFIQAGQTLRVWPEFKFEQRAVAAESLISPVATTDYTANTAKNGTGSDLTSSLTVSVTAQAESAEVILTNSGASDLYVTLFQLRGGAIDTPDVVNVESIDSDSVDDFGIAELSLDLKWQDDANTAQDFANYLKSWMPDFQPFPILELESRPTIQFEHDLAARITIQLASLDINQDFRIGHVRHQWLTRNGQGVRTTWHCEPLIYASNYWQFPTKIGVTSRFAF